LKESHKIVHGNASVSSLSEDTTLASTQDSQESIHEQPSPAARARERSSSRRRAEFSKGSKKKKSSSSAAEDVGTEVEISRAESIPNEDDPESSATIVSEGTESFAVDIHQITSSWLKYFVR
jgi:hypothetical protein